MTNIQKISKLPKLPTFSAHFTPAPDEKSDGKLSGEFPVIGLSNSFYPHVSLTLKYYRNGEIKGFTSVLTGKISPKKCKQCELYEKYSFDFECPNCAKLKRGRKKGKQLNQNGLTSDAKRSIRICASEYQKYVLDKKYGYQKSYCSFTTLSFRRILPKDNEECKKLFHTFLKRVYDKFGEIHYVWVQELQHGRYMNGKKSYRMTNGDAIHFHLLSPQYFDKVWINRCWNEIVMNHYYKKKYIMPIEFQQWSNELDLHCDYIRRLNRFQAKETTRQPEKPRKSEFLLLPNVTAVYNASKYMSKYLSKSGKELRGHQWNLSKRSKKIVKPIITKFDFNTVYACETFINRLIKKLRKNDIHLFKWRDYNDHTGFWSGKGTEIMNKYYDIIDTYNVDQNTGIIKLKDIYRKKEKVQVMLA